MQKPENPHRFPGREEWRLWLEENHASARDAWLAIRKVKTGQPAITLAEAVEEALCFGWVDSILMTLDDAEYTLRFTPRKAGSRWSQTNRERAARLIASGRMAPAGLQAIQAAKEKGTWDSIRKYHIPEDMPPEMAKRFQQDPDMQARFYAQPPSRQQAYLSWILDARTALTSAARLDRLADMLQQSPGRKKDQP